MKSILCLLPLFLPFQLAAQTSSPTSATESAGASIVTFERLEAKNRSRFFSDLPSPGGEHYIYLDDYNLNTGDGLSPEIQVQPQTRRVTTVVTSFTPIRLNRATGEASIGTVRLRNAEASPRKIQIKTTLDLKYPIRIQVRERAHQDPD